MKNYHSRPVRYKRMKYIADVDWNEVSKIPSLSLSKDKYYGMIAVQEVKRLRKELNIRGQKIRKIKKKISNLQGLLTELKNKNLINHLGKETLSVGAIEKSNLHIYFINHNESVSNEKKKYWKQATHEGHPSWNYTNIIFYYFFY